MHNHARPRCQTICRAAGLAFAWLRWTLGAAAAPSPAPTPGWQPELAALEEKATNLALQPAADPVEEARQGQALGAAYRLLAGKYPDAAPVQKAAGGDAAARGALDEAARLWRRAETLDPQDDATPAGLGEIFLRTGKAREAYAQFERAVNAKPGSAWHQFDLGNALYLFRHELTGQPGVPDEAAALRLALDHLRRASELAPEDLRLAQGYAETFYVFDRPDWRQALAAWQKVLALSGAQTDLPNTHLARISLRLARPEEVRRYLAAIRDPAFDGLKAKFLAQAARLPAQTAAAP